MLGLVQQDDESDKVFVRRKEKNTEKFEGDHRHTLYKEYLKIIADHSPPIFVMENVKGILSAKLDGNLIFPQILEDLENPQGSSATREWSKILYSLSCETKGWAGWR
jgi:DNA (cytosine-5)-methyltransferase 1